MGAGARVALLAVVVLTGGCSQLAYTLADKVYAALDLPWSPENAPTATSFPASADIRAVIGGKGEGLGCSIPGLMERLFFDRDPGREAPVALQFRQACVFHDYCYRHGHATYNYTKEDCDVMLQEHAYRLCRQIHAQDVSLEECRRRARVVLLGVNLGGGKNFQHGHRSTYFEFDPFPARANDYVVARVTRRPAQAADREPAGVLWTLLHRHGWVTFRRFDGTRWDAQGSASPFLRDKTTVPPFVVREEGRDRFLWLARRSLANTGVFAYAVDATTADSIARTLPTRMAFAGTENTRCDDQFASHEAEVGYSRHEYDCSSSVSKPLTIDCNGRPQPLIATLGYHAWTPNIPNASDDALAQLCKGSPSRLVIASSGLRLKSQGYRFVNSEFLLGRFGKAHGEWSLVAFARGYYTDEARTRAAHDWSRSAAATVRTLGGTAEAPLAEISLGEADEPVVPFRAEGDSHDRLIALVNPCYPRESCEMEVREWLPHASWQSSRGSLHLPLDWIRQPAQVVAAHEAGRGDWLFLSRVSSARDATLDEPWFVPDAVRLEYRLLRRHEAGWREHAKACVRVDLSRHLIAHDGPGLNDRYLLRRYDWLRGPLASGAARDPTPTQICASTSAAVLQEQFRRGPEALGARTTGELSWEGIKACVALRRNIAERWHRSQVIPGYLVARASAEGERLPDAAFVFNGFSRPSVIVRQGEPLQAEWAEPCPSG